MHNPHDHIYKLLFSERRTVQDLITGFIREEWVNQLDLDNIERVSGSFVTHDLRDRESDVIWRVPFADGWMYIYLLLEFQSSIDAFMALRIMTYVGLLYQDLVKQKALTPDGKLPPVMPIVLYNGDRRWNAALDIHSLVQESPIGLEKYMPSMRYLLLDEKAIAIEEKWSDETRNVVRAIFQLENARDSGDVAHIVELLIKWLYSSEQEALLGHFAVWIKSVLAPMWRSKVDRDTWQSLNNLHEVHTMLSERAKKWPDELREKGRKEGREEGRKEGREEGREEGLVQGHEDAARKMIIKTDMSNEVIAELSGLDISRIVELRNDVKISTCQSN